MGRRVAGMLFAGMVAMLSMLFMEGCTQQVQPKLGSDDKKFAAFYADYLILSGVASDESETVSLVGGRDIDSLFEVHALTLERFNELADAYKEEPRLWRAVLLEVKNNLQENGR